MQKGFSIVEEELVAAFLEFPREILLQPLLILRYRAVELLAFA